LLLVTKVLTWNDILKEHNAWHTFIWLSTLLMMSTYLTEFGMITWFSNNIQALVGSLHQLVALCIIGFVYFYTHYVFASMTAHISSMYGAFVAVAIAVGAPPMLAILSLAFLSSLCAGITHYGTGSAPVYFSAEYITLKDWWRVGGVLSIINIAIWMLVGSFWWKFIGLWH
jgi:DASS family divalent anion:Na+ symporter